MRRCRHCGYVIGRTPEHPCPAFRAEPELLPGSTDPTFMREAWNSRDGLERYRRFIRGR